MAAEDPRAALLDAGERLIAERGVDVPLRDIAAAAGQRNNSAVHYYFDSRAGLLEAIVDRRMNWLEDRRMGLLAR
ncbi:TetR family transcriptional regulator [Nocardia sp. R16R-3T]